MIPRSSTILLAEMRPILIPLLLVILVPVACAQSEDPSGGDPVVSESILDAAARQRLMTDVAWLADDAREGRLKGSPGGLAARAYLVDRFTEIGLAPSFPDFVQEFDAAGAAAANVVGHVAGTGRSNRVIVVTAHYDHLGIRNGQIFNGADDNASGTAGLLAMAEWFVAHPPAHTIVFAALDAEESGLRGASAFVAEPPVDLGTIAVNVNMDMVGRSDRKELYASGTFHYPALRPLIENVAERASVSIRFGHDGTPGTGQDWTNQSDHAAFHRKGIPFVYFGVEDHADYHRPTDDVEWIQPAFFAGAIDAVLATVAAFDKNLAQASPAGS